MSTINYCQANSDRMDYKYYRTIDVGIIGSRAIESANRSVVQKRMKLSGQRVLKGHKHVESRNHPYKQKMGKRYPIGQDGF